MISYMPILQNNNKIHTQKPCHAVGPADFESFIANPYARPVTDLKFALLCAVHSDTLRT